MIHAPCWQSRKLIPYLPVSHGSVVIVPAVNSPV